MALKRNIFNTLIFLMRYFLKEVNGHTSNQMKLKKVRQRFTTLLIYSQFLSFKALAKRAFINFGNIGDFHWTLYTKASFILYISDRSNYLTNIYICRPVHLSIIAYIGNFYIGSPNLTTWRPHNVIYWKIIIILKYLARFNSQYKAIW